MSMDELEALLAKATAAMRAHEAFMLTHDYDMHPDAPDDSLSAIADEIDAAINWCRSEGIAAARENERLREALEWALAEIDGNTDYRSGRQQIAAYNRARTALAGQP